MKEKVWTVIGSIAGVLGVIFAIWFFYQGRVDQSKKLGIEMISRSILVDENVSRTKQRIEILYDGRKIANYAILQFRVSNAGGQPIRSSDYEEQLRLHFENISEILSIEQVSSSTKQLQVVPSIERPSSLVFPSILLNQSDWFILEVGVAPEGGKKIIIEPKGRIAGIKQIEFKEFIEPPRKEIDTLRELLISMAASVIFAVVTFVILLFVRYLKENFFKKNEAISN